MSLTDRWIDGALLEEEGPLEELLGPEELRMQTAGSEESSTSASESENVGDSKDISAPELPHAPAAQQQDESSPTLAGKTKDETMESPAQHQHGPSLEPVTEEGADSKKTYADALRANLADPGTEAPKPPSAAVRGPGASSPAPQRQVSRTSHSQKSETAEPPPGGAVVSTAGLEDEHAQDLGSSEPGRDLREKAWRKEDRSKWNATEQAGVARHVLWRNAQQLGLVG